ncbi:MAG TPA: YfhO family protein, partial [Chloroflexota bacterium]|nr:YfhO family protein [Chloroflexota bacterium]
WIPGAIDLTPYVDREVDLILETRSPSAPTSTPAWGDMHLGPVADANQFKQVYAGEVSIWENTHALPRAFLIGDAQPATTTAGAVAHMQAPGFDPLQSAVVEIPSAEGLPSGSTPPGSASITLYRQAEVHIAVEAQRPALLVLTDSYFPGWHASIDGVEAPILPTDVAFRGVLVPPGTHQVTFEYAPASFSIGLALAAGALIGLAAALWRVR